MVPVNIDYNRQVRQRFATNCQQVASQIIALQARNEQISGNLLLAIEKGKAFREKWLVVLDNHELACSP